MATQTHLYDNQLNGELRLRDDTAGAVWFKAATILAKKSFTKTRSKATRQRTALFN